MSACHVHDTLGIASGQNVVGYVFICVHVAYVKRVMMCLHVKKTTCIRLHVLSGYNAFLLICPRTGELGSEHGQGCKELCLLMKSAG